MSAETNLNAIFDAERSLRRAESELLKEKPSEVSALLSKAVADAKAMADSNPTESELRLTRLSDLCAQVPGATMVEALIAILDDEQPTVRVQAAEALVDVAFDRYAEVARGIERVLDKQHSGPAMQELPWVIAEIAEPSAVPLISRFLTHSDAEVIASAIEALLRIGDPGAAPVLRKLVDDPRVVVVEEGDEEFTSTLGELASQALDELAE